MTNVSFSTIGAKTQTRQPHFGTWVAALALGCTVGLQAHAQVEITDPPITHHFGKIPIGATYATQYFSVFNNGTAPVTLGKASVDGSGLVACLAIGCPTIEPRDFIVSDGTGCSDMTLEPGKGCSTLVSFIPTGVGERLARLIFPVSGANPVTRTIAGTGVTQPLDCVLDWAEKEYQTILTNPTPTFLVSPFFARCYQNGAICLGADTAVPTFAPASVYVYQNNALQSLGFLSEFAVLAKCQ